MVGWNWIFESCSVYGVTAMTRVECHGMKKKGKRDELIERVCDGISIVYW